MKKIWLAGLAIAVAAVVVTGVAAAAPRGKLGGFGCWGGMGPWVKGAVRAGAGDAVEALKGFIAEIDLTDEQLGKIRDIQADSFEKMQELKAAMSQKLLELKNMYWQKEPDKDAIAAKQEEVAKIRGQMAEVRRQEQEQLNSVLTDEQRQKIEDLRGQWRGKRGMFGRRLEKKTPAAGEDSTTPGVTTN